MQIPKLVNLDQVGVVAGQRKIRVVLDKQVGHVAEVDKAIQGRGTKAVLLAQLIAEQPRRLAGVVD